MLVRSAYAIVLLIIGLATDSRAANVPSSVSYVYELHGISHSYVPTFHIQGDAGGVDNSRRISPLVYSGIAGTHVAGAIAGYNNVTALWGAPDGRFHFKDEFNDNLAFNDEVSHLFISYKLSQGLSSAYRILGFPGERARLFGLLEAAVIMTAVEFPVDAYNPRQGFGLTDIVADYAGIGLAWCKGVRSELDAFDLKTSIKSLSTQPTGVLGDNCDDYDNYIYWLTYRYRFVVLGAGYSTCRGASGGADPQMFLGVGSTIPDLVRPISGKLADRLTPLEFYFFNLRLRAL